MNIRAENMPLSELLLKKDDELAWCYFDILSVLFVEDVSRAYAITLISAPKGGL
jgi:hypothetical protein